MGRFVINGNNKLCGTIRIDGSKNAALPIIFACILVKGKTVIDNLPDIADVDVALEILHDFGAAVERFPTSVIIDTQKLVYKVPKESLVSKIRASSYLLGACLSRFGRAKIQRFGGCNFDERPIDMHVYAAEALGATLSGDELHVKKLCGLRKFNLAVIHSLYGSRYFNVGNGSVFCNNVADFKIFFGGVAVFVNGCIVIIA